MLNKQCLIYKFIPPKLYKRMHLTTRLYSIKIKVTQIIRQIKYKYHIWENFGVSKHQKNWQIQSHSPIFYPGFGWLAIKTTIYLLIGKQ